MKALSIKFYEQPFYQWPNVNRVYDVNENFVFQFEPKFNDKGDYADGELEMQRKVLSSLNSVNHEPIQELNLEIYCDDKGVIWNNGEPFITIRGWGNLTGTGGHHLPGEKAAKIQDDFSDWIIYKLSVQKSIIKS